MLGHLLDHLLVRSHRSQICLLCTAHSARALRWSHSFARSLTHSLLNSWDSEWLDVSKLGCSEPLWNVSSSIEKKIMDASAVDNRLRSGKFGVLHTRRWQSSQMRLILTPTVTTTWSRHCQDVIIFQNLGYGKILKLGMVNRGERTRCYGVVENTSKKNRSRRQGRPKIRGSENDA